MKNKKGFTLVEMMVVVLIIAGLAAIAYPTYTKAVMKARIAEALSLSEIVREAQQRSLALNGAYFSAFTNAHVTGRTRLIKANDVVVQGNGKLKKGSYIVSIESVNATETTAAVPNGCIIVQYFNASNNPVFTIRTHVEDSRIGCVGHGSGNNICNTIPSSETGTLNCHS